MTIMDAFLTSQEMPIRLGAFLGVFAIMAGWEVLAPRRGLQQRKSLRWSNNLALSVLNGVVVRAILPLTAVGIAAFAAGRGMGALNLLQVPYPFALVLGVLALLVNAAIYAWVFWRQRFGRNRVTS